MPTIKRMFMPIPDIGQTIRARGRSYTASPRWLGHLRTPGGGRTFPLLYIEALLSHAVGPINNRLAREFSTDPAARKAMTAAEAEFERRISERQQSSPYPGLLTTDDVAWLLGVSHVAANGWTTSGKLPFLKREGRKLVEPDVFRSCCTWVAPTPQ